MIFDSLREGSATRIVFPFHYVLTPNDNHRLITEIEEVEGIGRDLGVLVNVVEAIVQNFAHRLNFLVNGQLGDNF